MNNLVAANGMLPPAAWHALDAAEKAGWLGQLDDLHVRAQASVVAVAGRTSVRRVLIAWVALGLLDALRLGPVLAARAETGAAQAADGAIAREVQ